MLIFFRPIFHLYNQLNIKYQFRIFTSTDIENKGNFYKAYFVDEQQYVRKSI